MHISKLYSLLRVKTAMLCTAVLLTACSGDHLHKAVIEISGVDSNYPVYLMKIDTGFIRAVDSVMKPADNEIRFTFSLEKTGIYIIKNKDLQVEFIVSPVDKLYLDLLHNNVVGGADSLNLKFGQFIQTIHVIERQADSLASLFIISQSTDSFPLVREKVTNSFELLLRNANSASKSYISHNQSSIGIYRAINSLLKKSPVFTYDIDSEWFHLADSLLMKYHPGHPYSIWLQKRVGYYQKTLGDARVNEHLLKEGFVIPDITLPGTNRKRLKLNPIKNGITLLYLWSPSAKSRLSNAKVKLLAEKYEGKGFRLFTLAFYPDYEGWSSVIFRDKLWGYNMIDTVGQKSVIMKELHMPPLPSFILIDKNNKVMAHFRNTMQLEDWLNQYFKEDETNNPLN